MILDLIRRMCGRRTAWHDMADVPTGIPVNGVGGYRFKRIIDRDGSKVLFAVEGQPFRGLATSIEAANRYGPFRGMS
jgi:hypothetical protein